MKKGFTPILVLLIILILVGVGFVTYQSRLAGLTSSVTPSPSPISSLESDSYVNTKIPYKIGNPVGWQIFSEISKQGVNRDLDVLISSKNDPIYNLDQLYPKPFVAVYSKGIETEQDYNYWIDLFGSYRNAVFSNITKYGTKVTVIEGEAALGASLGGWYLKYYIFKSPDNKFAITIMTADTPKIENQDTFDQILSTFQFIDPSEAQ